MVLGAGMTPRLHFFGWGRQREDNLALLLTYISVSLMGRPPSHGPTPFTEAGPGCMVCFQVLLFLSP